MRAAAVNFNSILGHLKLRGFLLLADSTLPSLAGLVAKSSLKGSWWAHPKGHEIFSMSEKLDDHPDVATARLILGKITFIHNRLWPALFVVGKSKEPWQTKGLSPLAKKLLARVETEGLLKIDELQKFRRRESKTLRNAVHELESNLLVYSAQFHTETGAHAKRIESWHHWSHRVKLDPPRISATEAKAQLENAIDRFGRLDSTRALLSWETL